MISIALQKLVNTSKNLFNILLKINQPSADAVSDFFSAESIDFMTS